ncbi:HTH domain-containing protein [Lysinibacillus sp. S2017]|uniref:HTH domain-containing protein n=1 Tax=Lysinibacillus sp. S2017 TaxID=2561923 RepID=UPI003513D521
MRKVLFTPKQIQQLQKNPNVQNVSERTITYTDAFKSRFIDGYLTGRTPRQIFKEYGFDEEIIGIKRIEQAARNKRLNWLTDTRKSGLGRPLKRKLTMVEIMERQVARIELLDGQVELLKKLEVTERRLLSESQKLSTNKVFQLISDTLNQFPFERMVTYFCALLNVSRSGYYNYLKTSDVRAAREQKDLEARDLIFKRQGTPGKVLVLLTDISYLPYNGNCMAYLSTIKDASTNETLAYLV